MHHQNDLSQLTEKQKMKKPSKDLRPTQLSLFEILEGFENDKYSNLINFYALLPIYSYTPPEDDFSIIRKHIVNGEVLKVIVDRAIIQDEMTGIKKPAFLGEREEIIQDVLFKLASRPEKLQLYEKQAGFNFSLTEIQNELKKVKHTYSYDQIKESLEILKKTQITLKKEGEKKARHIFSPIEDLILLSKEEYHENIKNKAEETTCFLRFNSYVTEAIIKGDYRLFDYKKSMQLSCFARYLFKRLSAVYKQANFDEPYNISLNTLFEESSFDKWNDDRENRRRIKKILKELMAKEIISFVKEITKKEGRKIVDVIYELRPARNFTEEVKKVNWYEKDRNYRRGFKK